MIPRICIYCHYACDLTHGNYGSKYAYRHMVLSFACGMSNVAADSTAGKLVNQSVRAMDTAFRYGGDEFAAILSETSLGGASRVAERLRKGINLRGLWRGAFRRIESRNGARATE